MKGEIKWNKNSYPVEIDTSQPPALLKATLFSLTGVPPERQKVMVKGGILKDDQDWSTTGLKEGFKVMMMGTADAIPEPPANAPTFVEDLPQGHQDKAGMPKGISSGLQNLGNTCYMNATLQCLYNMPELRTALQSYPEAPAPSAPHEALAHKLTVAARDLFGDMEKSGEAVTPFRFLSALHAKYPHFGQKQGGVFMQQDAEECWTQVLYTLKERLEAGGNNRAVDELFGVDVVTKLTCPESQEESVDAQHQFMLKCNIDQTVNSLMDGLQLALKEDREKHSEALGRTVKWEGQSKIAKLPKFLTIQEVRFFFKREINTKAKMLRSVAFPLQLDVYPLCSEDLKAQLDGPRAREQEERDRAIMEGRGAKKAKTEDAEMKEDGAPSTSGAEAAPAPEAPAAQDKPLTGRYELCAVLTHKGRTADSGHYVAWVKSQEGQWIEYDDDDMTPRKEEDILKLCGGGDWHMSYLLVYKAV